MVGVDGRFGERLDPATWDIGLLPPPTAMLPRLWLANTNVTVDTNVGDVKLPRGVMVHGVVHAPDGAPVVGADVRLFTEAPSNVNCSPGDLTCLSPPRLRAEGPTDQAGGVIVILPSVPVD
jgi:hypothetical protein